MTKKVFIELEVSELEALITSCVNSCLKSQGTETKKIPEKEYLSTKDVCKLLNVSRGTVVNYTSSGLLKSYKINRKVIYKSAEVSEAINKLSTQGEK